MERSEIWKEQNSPVPVNYGVKEDGQKDSSGSGLPLESKGTGSSVRGERRHNEISNTFKGKTVKRQLRGDTTTKLGDVKYKFLESLIYSPCSAPVRQAPTGFIVIGHILWLNKESKGKRVKLSEILRAVASDLSDSWEIGLNFYPCSLSGLRKKLVTVFKEFTNIRDYPKAKRGDKFNQTMKEFNNRMQKGFDIRTPDMDREKDLEHYYMVISS